MSNICYDHSKKFKPEWAYSAPPGQRAESFVIPFSFQVPADGQIHQGYGWKLDDDVPWLFRGMVFPQPGTGEPEYGLGNPGLVRIYDTRGNPLTNCLNPINPALTDMVLAVGAISQSGYAAINASGFPFGCEIDCERGGMITFDFLIPNATGASPAPIIFMQGTMLGAKLFDEC